MKTNYLIYYVLKLITKGQEWQYKNLNGKGDRPKLYFTQLQLIALLISTSNPQLRAYMIQKRK